jgi:hypothetical protein
MIEITKMQAFLEEIKEIAEKYEFNVKFGGDMLLISEKPEKEEKSE